MATQTPPAALILSSAEREKKRALTMTGWAGSRPLPRTLKKPHLVTSITGAVAVFLAAATRSSSGMRDQSLSKLIELEKKTIKRGLPTDRPCTAQSQLSERGFETARIKSGLGNLSIKNRLRDRFSCSNCRQVTGPGPNFRQESRTGF